MILNHLYAFSLCIQQGKIKDLSRRKSHFRDGIKCVSNSWQCLKEQFYHVSITIYHFSTMIVLSMFLFVC